MTNISKAQKQINLDRIGRLLNHGLSHHEIMDQLQIGKSAFYEYLKELREVEMRVWEKVEIDSAKYRALSLLRSFEETVRICSLIANANNTSNKDRIEARKAVDMANAHIFRLVSEGTMFHHLPEVSKYVKIIEHEQQQQQQDNHSLPYQGTDSTDTYHDIDSSSNIDNNNNNNINDNQINLNSNQSELSESEHDD